MSAQKMREVVRQIQGLPALQAQAVLAVVPRKGARFVAKTLHSAIANAENNNKLKPETLAHQGSGGRHGDEHQAVSRPRRAVRPVRSSSAAATSKSLCPTNNTMGQKTNPIGLRVAVNKDWRSKWYADKKEFGKLLTEDREIRDAAEEEAGNGRRCRRF